MKHGPFSARSRPGASGLLPWRPPTSRHPDAGAGPSIGLTVIKVSAPPRDKPFAAIGDKAQPVQSEGAAEPSSKPEGLPISSTHRAHPREQPERIKVSGPAATMTHHEQQDRHTAASPPASTGRGRQRHAAPCHPPSPLHTTSSINTGKPTTINSSGAPHGDLWRPCHGEIKGRPSQAASQRAARAQELNQPRCTRHCSARAGLLASREPRAPEPVGATEHHPVQDHTEAPQNARAVRETRRPASAPKSLRLLRLGSDTEPPISRGALRLT